MATEFFGATLQPTGAELPYSLSLGGTLQLTQASLSSFLPGKTYLYATLFDGDQERTHLLAVLVPVIHESVRLDLFFVAHQTVAFRVEGPNSLGVAGILERAIAQEEDPLDMMSNDMISARLGFGAGVEDLETGEGIRAEATELLRHNHGDADHSDIVERIRAIMAEGGGEDGFGGDDEDDWLDGDAETGFGSPDQVSYNEEGEKDKKTKKKKKKKRKTQQEEDGEGGGNGDASSSASISNDPMLRMAESVRRKCVSRMTQSMGKPLIEISPSPLCTLWTSDKPDAAAIGDGKALRLAHLNVMAASRKQKEPLAAFSSKNLVLRLGLGLLPAPLESAFKGLRRGSQRVVWMSRSLLSKKDTDQLEKAIGLPVAKLGDKDCDLFIQLQVE